MACVCKGQVNQSRVLYGKSDARQKRKDILFGDSGTRQGKLHALDSLGLGQRYTVRNGDKRTNGEALVRRRLAFDGMYPASSKGCRF